MQGFQLWKGAQPRSGDLKYPFSLGGNPLPPPPPLRFIIKTEINFYSIINIYQFNKIYQVNNSEIQLSWFIQSIQFLKVRSVTVIFLVFRNEFWVVIAFSCLNMQEIVFQSLSWDTPKVPEGPLVKIIYCI